jgi:hypothetical protein
LMPSHEPLPYFLLRQYFLPLQRSLLLRRFVDE